MREFASLVGTGDDMMERGMLELARKGYDDLLDILLRFPGLNLEYTDADGNTALKIASKNGHLECVEI